VNPQLKSLLKSMALTAALLSTQNSFAYPVDPAKVPVNLAQDPGAAHDFVLAYDDVNQNVVYYAPKTGRTATLNGAPLVGFAVLGNGDAYLNAQLEFGVFGADRQRLLKAIAASGKTPVIFPYRRTKVVPLTPGIDPTTGKEVCEQITDPSTGQTEQECSGSIYKQLLYSTKGPSLGEYFAVTALLKPAGALVFQDLLHSQNALQLNLEGEYYATGTAFEAIVTVNYDKLFENFHAFASYNGWLTKAQAEAFYQNETLCPGRQPSECGVWIDFKDLRTGQSINTATIDPSNAAQQQAVLQAAQRLAATLRDQMLAPMTQALGPLDTSKPTLFKLSAQYERQKRGMHATFSFKSPNGVNVNTTTVPVALGCVLVDSIGNVSKNFLGACGEYWQ
jgi:hypothetical protein